MTEVSKETQVEGLRRLMEELRDLGCSIKEKATQLASTPEDESDVEAAGDSPNIGSEFQNSLRTTRRILKEALATLSAFV